MKSSKKFGNFIKALGIFLFLVLIVSLIIVISQRNNYILKGIQDNYDAGNTQKAKDQVEEYLYSNPNSSTAWLLYGQINLDDGFFNIAMDNFLKALAIDPSSYKAYTNLAIVQEYQNNFNQAEVYVNKAITLNNSYASAYSNLSIIKLFQKDFSKSIELGEKAYSIENNNSTIAANLAISYHYDGLNEKRDSMYEKASQLGYKNLDGLKEIFKTQAPQINNISKLNVKTNKPFTDEIINKSKEYAKLQDQNIKNYINNSINTNF